MNASSRIHVEDVDDLFLLLLKQNLPTTNNQNKMYLTTIAMCIQSTQFNIVYT